LFNSAFEGFRYQGDFGLFKAEKNILFQASVLQSRKMLMTVNARVTPYSENWPQT